MSHGPAIGPPEIVFTAFPDELTMIRQPALAVFDMPFAVGSEPTITQPLFRTASAVVRPTPPGQLPWRLLGASVANTLARPFGEICMIVVPVPCRFFLLLKLLTRM